MINSSLKILSTTSMNMVELRNTLERIKERDKELNFRANKTKEYLDQFVTLSSKETEELKNKLIKLGVPRLKEEHINKIIDILPLSIDSLKVLLQSYTITVNQDNMKKIADSIKEFAVQEKK